MTTLTTMPTPAIVAAQTVVRQAAKEAAEIARLQQQLTAARRAATQGRTGAVAQARRLQHQLLDLMA